MQPSSAYLVLYNTAQAAGWGWVLFSAIRSILAHRDAVHVFMDAGPTVRLVGGSPMAAFTQWFGRSNILFALVACIPELWSSPVVAILFIAWALSEVIRYPWYTATLLGGAPHALTWLRYTAFYVLYPVGLVCEMWLLYSGLPAIAERGLHSVAMPNRLNWAFNYHTAMLGLLVLYPFLWWPLYSMLISQRRKKLKTA